MNRITGDGVVRRAVLAAMAVAVASAVGSGCRPAPGMSDADRDITSSDMRARIAFLASDMLKGRDTPSPGLDIAANYIASEFRRVGLVAPQGGFVQRYHLVRTEMGDGWSLSLGRGSRRASLTAGEDFWGVPWAAGTVEGPVRFVGDHPPPASPSAAATVWIARLSTSLTPRDWLAAASEAGALGILFVLPRGLEYTVADWLERNGRLYELADFEPTLPAALIGEAPLRAAMERLGLEVWPAVDSEREASLSARLTADMRVETATAPNVVGILPGSEGGVEGEYVIVSAHMDGLGVGPPVDGDSIYNGADDNASGTAGVLEIAEAAASLERRPRRSLVFLAVSGEEKGLLGSAWFVRHPPIPLDRVVANLNIDMIGRNWEDTIAVIGKPFSSLGSVVDSVAGANPGLGLSAVGDLWPAERFFWRSDHFNFARNGIPAVFFFNGVHVDYHRPSDEFEAIKVGKAARVARLIFEVAYAVADAEDPPRWDPRARATIVEPR